MAGQYLANFISRRLVRGSRSSLWEDFSSPFQPRVIRCIVERGSKKGGRMVEGRILNSKYKRRVTFALVSQKICCLQGARKLPPPLLPCTTRGLESMHKAEVHRSVCTRSFHLTRSFRSLVQTYP